MTGRQDADAVARVGLPLMLRQAQAAAGDITLLFADESEALTHPYLAHAWAERGADLRIRAPGQAKKGAIMGALDAGTRELIVHTARTKRSSDAKVSPGTADRIQSRTIVERSIETHSCPALVRTGESGSCPWT